MKRIWGGSIGGFGCGGLLGASCFVILRVSQGGISQQPAKPGQERVAVPAGWELSGDSVVFYQNLSVCVWGGGCLRSALSGVTYKAWQPSLQQLGARQPPQGKSLSAPLLPSSLCFSSLFSSLPAAERCDKTGCAVLGLLTP